MNQTLKARQEGFGVLVILFASLLWGTTGTAATYAPDISPLAIGAFSMGVGGIMMALFACGTIRKDRYILVSNKLVLLLGALALAVYPLAFYSSMRMAGVAIGTVVSIASAPFFVALLECLFGKEKSIDTRWVISLTVGATGIVLLTLSETSTSIQTGVEQTKYIGIVLGLLAGFTYATYAWTAKALIIEGVQSKSAMGSIFGLGSLLLLPSLFFTGGNLFATSINASVALYMALVPMFLGYVCFGYGLTTVSASKASLLTLFEPAVAAVLAVVVVGEHIGLLGWIGIGLIMVCLLLQSYQPKHREPLLAAQSQ
ncbi:DMT family transporter [Vibrio neptunius]|uniref:EamA family transporter n=1 Tax=Vibrio neptunius TaxID=170651 RepID=A0ABS3A796_9VIBR|nr:EamA family transporter [Vibrio neptunius]MBN3494122.1 EamA family transporter [Vibrio neptunius]MBN3516882.1 EamA family transporter [Vibrio neptunius]MBN3550793.1 EamA family transporter [Vibrio neptunius]MBN3578924.1 EamA family transporter [Vibrio neptunius]MCH9872589.1 EamA family transporter [Vibrio neptunius]